MGGQFFTMDVWVCLLKRSRLYSLYTQPPYAVFYKTDEQEGYPMIRPSESIPSNQSPKMIYLWILLSAVVSSCFTVALIALFFSFPVRISFLTTETPTPTQTATPTSTFTLTPSSTPINTATFTITPLSTPTLTFAPSLTATHTETPTITLTSSYTPTATQTESPTATQTFTPTLTSTPTHSYSLKKTVDETIIYLGATAVSQNLFTVPKGATLYVTTTQRGCWVFVTYQPSSGGGSISGWITTDHLGESCSP
jgi:hypothetical protein